MDARIARFVAAFRAGAEAFQDLAIAGVDIYIGQSANHGGRGGLDRARRLLADGIDIDGMVADHQQSTGN